MDEYDRRKKSIINGDIEHARAVLWPKIKDAVRACTNLSKGECRRLMLLIPEYLYKQTLKPGEMSEILSIEELVKRSQSTERPPIWHLY